jgi:hypothetical protein
LQSPYALNRVELIRSDGSQLCGIDTREIAGDLLNPIDRDDARGCGINDNIALICFAAGDLCSVRAGGDGDFGPIAYIIAVTTLC